MKKRIISLLIGLSLMASITSGCTNNPEEMGMGAEAVQEQPDVSETMTESSEESAGWENIPQEELDAKAADEEALKKMEEAYSSVQELDDISDEEVQGLVGDITAAAESAESTGAELAIDVEYPFSGDGGQEVIDWEALEAQCPGISFVLSIPDLGIHLPVLLDSEVETAPEDTALVEGDLNSDGFVSKLIVYTDDAEADSPLKNIRVYADSEFFDGHPYVYVYAKDYTYEYQVFAAYDQYVETDIHEYDFDNLEEFWLYLGTVFNQKGMGINLNQDLQMTVMLEHQIFEILLPNSDGTVFAVQAVVNGRKAR